MNAKTTIPTTRLRPTQARSRALVDAIEIAAAQLLLSVGPQTTTNDIAERAGVSIGSLYRYFPNKDAIFVAVSERYATRLDESAEALFEETRGLSIRDTSHRIAQWIGESEKPFQGLGGVLIRMQTSGYTFPAFERFEQNQERRIRDGLLERWGRDPAQEGPLKRAATLVARSSVGIVRLTMTRTPHRFQDEDFAEEFSAFVTSTARPPAAGADVVEPSKS